MEEEQNPSENKVSSVNEDHAVNSQYFQPHGFNSELSETDYPSGTQDNSGFTQEQEIMEACQNINNSSATSPRKRKIDKDGFVTPATPDIPKSSCRYGQSKVMREDDDVLDQLSQDMESNQPKDQVDEEEEEGCYIEVPPHTQRDLSLMPTHDIMKDMAEEAKNIYEQYTRIFREAEDYEILCSNKVDKLGAESIALEDDMNKQKQIICNRLKGLSRTLQQL